jgi:hypothetical protein
MQLLSKQEYNQLSPEQRSVYLQQIKDEREGGKVDNLDLPMSTAGNIDPHVTSALTNMALSKTPLGNVPVLGSVVPSTLNAAMQGATPEQVATVAGQTAVSSGAGYALDQLFDLPGLPSLGASLVGEAFSDTPNYVAAGTKNLVNNAAGLIGNALFPVVGGIAAASLSDYFAQKSLEDGWLGDFADSRSNENMRDTLEDDWGLDVDATKDMANIDKALGDYANTDGYGLGLTANHNSTANAQINRSFSLKDYMNARDDDFGGNDNVGGDRGSSTGTGGGYNDGNGGVSGL